MHGITKVFLSGFGGAFVAQWVGPKVTGSLPESLKTPTMAKVVNGVIAGGSAAAVYYLIGAVAK